MLGNSGFMKKLHKDKEHGVGAVAHGEIDSIHIVVGTEVHELLFGFLFDLS